jgi:hypothetical protein
MKAGHALFLFACLFALHLWPDARWIAWVGFVGAAGEWIFGVVAAIRRAPR